MQKQQAYPRIGMPKPLGHMHPTIQYYIGHSVEDPAVSRNHYTNKDKLLSLLVRLKSHPLCVILNDEVRNQSEDSALYQEKDIAAGDIDVSKLGAYRHFIAEATANEPNDDITLSIESDAPFDISLYYTNAISGGYSETANIRKIMADAYRNAYRK